MMTREAALEIAAKILGGEHPHTLHAKVLIAYAEELRAGSAGPALDRILEQAGKRLPPDDPTARLTLHDVEAQLCTRHLLGYTSDERIAIRDRRASSEWWMHADDQSSCA